MPELIPNLPQRPIGHQAAKPVPRFYENEKKQENFGRYEASAKEILKDWFDAMEDKILARKIWNAVTNKAFFELRRDYDDIELERSLIDHLKHTLGDDEWKKLSAKMQKEQKEKNMAQYVAGTARESEQQREQRLAEQRARIEEQAKLYPKGKAPKPKAFQPPIKKQTLLEKAKNLFS